MKTVGLFDKDTHIYFVSNDFVILGNPCNGDRPTLVKRKQGNLTEDDKKHMKSALALVDMELIGDPWFREDNLWCHEVKEVRR